MSKVKSNKASNVQRRLAVLGRVMMVVSFLLLVGSSWAWWHYVRNNPENTFNAMVVNNFRTGGVTRTVEQSGGGQKFTQIMRAQNQGMNVVRGETVVERAGGAKGGTVVVTENVGTPSVDYTRYTSIVTSQKGTKGQELNFDNVINQWAKAEVPSADNIGSVYQDAMLGSLFMFADLSQDQRNELLKLIENEQIYQVDFDNVKKEKVDGRPKYIYKLTIDPAKYILLLKNYGVMIGLTQLEKLDPAEYEQGEPLNFTVVVDVISQRLSELRSPSGSIQKFNGYGVVEHIVLPEETIPADDLQQRFTENASV